MKKNRFTTITVALLAGAIGWIGLSLTAHAQQSAIERVKLTDNELSCAQVHGEVGEMDRIASEARAAESEGTTTALAGTAGNVATEVAGRTGLFGSLGGLTGHILGQVAGKTAASAAQQSGQTTAQQAVERGRQAVARKETLSTLFLDKGCKTSDLSYNPPTPVRATAPVPTPVAAAGVGLATGQAASSSAAISLPDLNPADWFDGKMGGTFGEKSVAALTRSNRVALAGFRVVFVTHNETSAITRGSYLPGRDTDAEFADMQKVDENNKGTVMSLFGALGARSSQSVNVAKTTNATYARAANAVLAQATGTFARLFVTNEVARLQASQ